MLFFFFFWWWATSVADFYFGLFDGLLTHTVSLPDREWQCPPWGSFIWEDGCSSTSPRIRWVKYIFKYCVLHVCVRFLPRLHVWVALPSFVPFIPISKKGLKMIFWMMSFHLITESEIRMTVSTQHQLHESVAALSWRHVHLCFSLYMSEKPKIYMYICKKIDILYICTHYIQSGWGRPLITASILFPVALPVSW